MKRDVECNTDNQMLRIKLKMTRKKRYQRRNGCLESGRFGVSKLHGKSVAEDGTNTTKGCFQEQVSIKAGELWLREGTVEEKLTAIRSALSETAQSVLGKECRRHPDWFKESSVDLDSMFEQRNELYSRWLSSGKETDRMKFVKARSDARQAIRETKNRWFKQKATEAQQGRSG